MPDKPLRETKAAIDYWPIENLQPYARNARTHSEDQIAKVAASIQRFGFTNPVLITDTGGIIAGHGRVLAAKLLGLTEVPVIVVSGWSDEERRAYIIADNQLALEAGWDEELLRLELGDLRSAGFDISLTGFDTAALDFILDGITEAQTGAGSLAEKFGVPPFSVLNAREGWWQDRKQTWISLGIQSELGRGQDRLEMSHPATTATIDFYAQKRKLEAEQGRKLTTDEARGILAGRGMIIDDRAVNAKRKANACPGGSPRPLDRRKNAAPGGSPRPAADYSKRQRGNGKGQPID